MDYDEYSVVPIPARSRMEVQDDPDFQMVGEVKTNPEPVLPVAVKNVADDTSDTDDEVSEAVAAAFRRCQKKKILVVDDSDDPGSDSDYDASSESESSTTNKTEKSEKSEKTEKTDVEFDYSDSNSEDEMRAEEQVRRTIVKHQDTMGLLGTAEQLRRKSATGQAFQTANGSKKASSKTVQATLPPQYYPLTYPTADPDVGEGFQLSGFLNGKRVYRLESEYLSKLRSMVVKTGVGLCYLDIESMLPPKVVQVPANKGNDEAMSIDTDPVTPPLTLPQVCDAETQLITSFADMSLATSPSAPHPLSPSPTPQSPLVPAEQPHLEVNDCFVVRPSALGGLGAFALRDLVRGQHILVERPLLRTSLCNMPHELDRLAPEQRAQFDALTGHHPDPYASTAERIWTANTFDAGGTEAVFAVASRFNHACVPRNNIGYHYDRRKNVLTMTAIKKIAAGTELVITYGKSPSELFLRFGFRCVCGACSGFTEEMSRQQQLRSWSG